jgi:hypothetical protein
VGTDRSGGRRSPTGAHLPSRTGPLEPVDNRPAPREIRACRAPTRRSLSRLNSASDPLAHCDGCERGLALAGGPRSMQFCKRRASSNGPAESRDGPPDRGDRVRRPAITPRGLTARSLRAEGDHAAPATRTTAFAFPAGARRTIAKATKGSSGSGRGRAAARLEFAQQHASPGVCATSPWRPVRACSGEAARLPQIVDCGGRDPAAASGVARLGHRAAGPASGGLRGQNRGHVVVRVLEVVPWPRQQLSPGCLSPPDGSS